MPKPVVKRRTAFKKLYKRKEERKELRKSKKQRKASHFLAKSGTEVKESANDSGKRKRKMNDVDHEQESDDTDDEEMAKQRLLEYKEQKKQRDEEAKKKERLMHQIALEKEEKLIKSMEKKLKLNKRRKKGSIPKSFYDEGLGEVLDFVDKRNLDDEEEFARLKSKKPKLSEPAKIASTSKARKKDNPFSDDEIDEDEFEREFGGGVKDEDDDGLDSDMSGEESADEGSGFSDLEGGGEDASDDSDQSDRDGEENPREDIYGRNIDAKGNLIASTEPARKLLPATYEKEEVSPELLRRIRGQLNRITSSNLPGISTFLEGLYKTNSFFQMNEGTCKCVCDLLVVDVNLSPLKLVSELVLLMATLHENIGEEVGGHAVHYFINLFNDLVHSIDKDVSKKVDNAVAILCYFYACGLLDPQLMFEVIDELVTLFDEKCIELLVFVLISIGFILRKDNPALMKALVLNVQKKAADVDKDNLSGGKRVEYMIEMITAIKNNNLLKVTSRSSGVVNPIEKEELRNVLKNTLKRSSKVNYIPGRYKQVLLSNRWWIKVGTLLELTKEDKKDVRTSATDAANDFHLDNDVDERLCRALRLNTTPLRKSLFKALISSSDYIEASERLTQIGKKQFSEVANVVIHVALHEKNFNLFYAHLLKSLSGIDRKYKIAIQFALKDKILDLKTLKEKQQRNLDCLVFHLIKESVTSINTLKVIEFSDLNEVYVKFLRAVLGKVLAEPEPVMKEILSKVPKKDNFASALKLFINCFMDKNLSEKSRGLIKAKLKFKP